MEIKIQAIHFEATARLHEFIQKKTLKLEKLYSDIKKVEVVLKVVKPETTGNKEVGIKLLVPNGELYAAKVKDTFEEGVDEAVEALLKQLQKFKEKQRAK
ncbi:MAG: ribosome-associated translation inhibitor RaiA [Bacteroidaceae bacterium]|nr:ribosome-associated translation inhibitor RaiA [Bacteroidaceae bacterium]